MVGVFCFSGSPSSCYFIFYVCSINLYCTLANKYDDDNDNLTQARTQVYVLYDLSAALRGMTDVPTFFNPLCRVKWFMTQKNQMHELKKNSWLIESTAVQFKRNFYNCTIRFPLLFSELSAAFGDENHATVGTKSTQIDFGKQMIRAKYDSRKLTGRFAQDDSRNRGWFAQFYGCFAQASCYVVFLSN